MYEQVARLDREIAGAARPFVLLRIGNLRGIDLDLFDFDYDLPWMAFFLNADGKVYGRYGGRHPDAPGRYLSLAGLRHALEAALEAHRREPPPVQAPRARAARTAEQYPAARRMPTNACIHCHHVHEFRREEQRARGAWRLDDEWVYPLPENVGLTLDVDHGGRLRAVEANSPAARSGLVPGDTLKAVNGLPVVSFADVQYALHRAPAHGRLALVWERNGTSRSAAVELSEGWRKTDISWRHSLKGLPPDPRVHGEDLGAEERKALGLGPRQLALRQGAFVTPSARHAGVQTGDVIVGLDGRPLEMTARQFTAHVRLHYRVGDAVLLNVLRAGKPLDLKLKLAE